MTDAINRTLYQKVADDLRSQIASGVLQVGDQIPSTAELGLRYDVSATAVRNAVSLLREQGLLEGIPGKGVFVAATPSEMEQRKLSLQFVHEEVSGLRDALAALGERVETAQPAEVTAQLDALTTAVGQLQADLRLLYDRLGQPYPQNESAPKQKRRTGA